MRSVITRFYCTAKLRVGPGSLSKQDSMVFVRQHTLHYGRLYVWLSWLCHMSSLMLVLIISKRARHSVYPAQENWTSGVNSSQVLFNHLCHQKNSSHTMMLKQTADAVCYTPVSYTHLDVYKRQILNYTTH